MTAYIIIERERSERDLAIEYPDRDAAEHALEHSVFIDGLCEEDCLDAWVQDDLTFWIDPIEHVIPPQEATPMTHEWVDHLDENVRSGEDLDSLDLLTAALHHLLDKTKED